MISYSQFKGGNLVFYVYILKCFKNRKFTNFYVGQTNNIGKRTQEHFENVRSRDTDRYTGRFDFVKLVWSTTCNSRSEAMKLERKIKGLSHLEKAELIKRG